MQSIVGLHQNQFIKLNLNMNLRFLILFHDPNFFFLSNNPHSTTETALAIDMNELNRADNISRHIPPVKLKFN